MNTLHSIATLSYIVRTHWSNYAQTLLSCEFFLGTLYICNFPKILWTSILTSESLKLTNDFFNDFIHGVALQFGGGTAFWIGFWSSIMGLSTIF